MRFFKFFNCFPNLFYFIIFLKKNTEFFFRTNRESIIVMRQKKMRGCTVKDNDIQNDKDNEINFLVNFSLLKKM